MSKYTILRIVRTIFRGRGIFALVPIILVFGGYWLYEQGYIPCLINCQGTETQAQVVRVSDGDTIVVRENNAETTVRLLGIDTPETVAPGKPVECGGPEASDFLKKMLPEGTEVKLETDPKADAEDRYGRTLAYVYKNDKLLQQAILLNGHASVNTYGNPLTQIRDFNSWQKKAQDKPVGIWANC
jgi:micrococcal nuclease